MKVFLDTNILVDYVEDRNVFSKYASIIFQLSLMGEIELYAIDISFLNVAYILRKKSSEILYDALGILLQRINVLSVTRFDLENAINAKHNDFEDCVQFYSALSGDMDCIITRNKKDFENSDIPVYTSSEFLDLLNIEY
ncbi:MAG: PIN domain-containing protein [Paludibacteraceae bacterium]|nr:PIN domain-containing protein [Paludibacteraceae bacterium]